MTHTVAHSPERSDFENNLERLTESILDIHGNGICLRMQETMTYLQEIERIYSRASRENYSIFCKKLDLVIDRCKIKKGATIQHVGEDARKILDRLGDRLRESFEIKVGITSSSNTITV